MCCLTLCSLQHASTCAFPDTESLCQTLQPYHALQMWCLYREWHGCCSGFVVSANTSFKQLFTSIQVAKLFDTHEVFSWWNIRMIIHSFCSIRFIFFQFLWWKPCDINSKFLAKVKIYSTLNFPETQYDHIVLQEMKTWLPENKKASEAPNHLIFCGCLEDSIPCKLWSGHWLPQLCDLLVGLQYNSNNISNIVNEVC